jgi:hypothetical protein
MSLSNFCIPAAVVGLALLAVPPHPAKAQGFPDCHNNSRQIGNSFFIFQPQEDSRYSTSAAMCLTGDELRTGFCCTPR